MGGVENTERRVRERVETDIGIMCRIPAMPGSARILDLSHRGCRIELGKKAGAEKGATIILDMPNGDQVRGQIIWVQGKKAGVRFLRPLNPSTAVCLGIEDEPEVQVVISTPEPETTGLLHHWFRRLSKIF